MNPCLYSDNARRIAKQKADAEARREELKQNIADVATAFACVILGLLLVEIFLHL